MKEPRNTNNSSFGGGQKNLTLDRVTSINDKNKDNIETDIKYE